MKKTYIFYRKRSVLQIKDALFSTKDTVKRANTIFKEQRHFSLNKDVKRTSAYSCLDNDICAER